jgi:hypothetical protein
MTLLRIEDAAPLVVLGKRRSESLDGMKKLLFHEATT